MGWADSGSGEPRMGTGEPDKGKKQMVYRGCPDESPLPPEASGPERTAEDVAVGPGSKPGVRRRKYLFVLACLCYALGGLALWLGKTWIPGMYAGHLRGWATLYSAPGKGNFYSYWVDFSGVTPRRFSRPKHYPFRYQHLQLISDTGELELSLSSMSYRWGRRQGAFTPAVLRDYLAGRHDPNLLQADHVEKLYGFLVSAGGGEFPRPRHHLYHLDDLEGKNGWPPGLMITFTHFAHGENLYGLWVLLPLLFGAILHILARRGAQRKT